MLYLFSISSALHTTMIVGGLFAIIVLLIRNYINAHQRKFYEGMVEIQIKDSEKNNEEQESLFVQLLMCRRLAEEYRDLIHRVFPGTKPAAIATALAELESRFASLHKNIETDRKNYMKKISQEPNFNADFQVVLDQIVEKMKGSGLGSKAEESTTLNSNREN